MYKTLISTTHCWQTPFSWHIDEPEHATLRTNLGIWFFYKTPPIPCTHSRNFLWDPDAVMPISTCYHKLLLLLSCSFTSLWNSYLSSFCTSSSPGQSRILYLLPIRSVFFCLSTIQILCFLALLQLLRLFSLHKVLLLLSSFSLNMLSVLLKAGLTDHRLEADFSSSLQHHAYAPPPLQVFSVELVLPGQCLMALPPEEGHRDVRCAWLWATGTSPIMSIVDCCLSNRPRSSSPCHYQRCALVIRQEKCPEKRTFRFAIRINLPLCARSPLP